MEKHTYAVCRSNNTNFHKYVLKPNQLQKKTDKQDISITYTVTNTPEYAKRYNNAYVEINIKMMPVSKAGHRSDHSN